MKTEALFWSSHSFRCGNVWLSSLQARSKNLATIGEISGLVIQALKEIEKDYLTQEEKTKLVVILKKEKPLKLQHDIKLAPEWIRNIMKEALPEKQ